jgi:hypothetical protein
VQLWCRVMERERADLPLIALAEAMRAGFR